MLKALQRKRSQGRNSVNPSTSMQSADMNQARLSPYVVNEDASHPSEEEFILLAQQSAPSSHQSRSRSPTRKRNVNASPPPNSKRALNYKPKPLEKPTGRPKSAAQLKVYGKSSQKNIHPPLVLTPICSSSQTSSAAPSTSSETRYFAPDVLNQDQIQFEVPDGSTVEESLVQLNLEEADDEVEKSQDTNSNEEGRNRCGNYADEEQIEMDKDKDDGSDSSVRIVGYYNTPDCHVCQKIARNAPCLQGEGCYRNQTDCQDVHNPIGPTCGNQECYNVQCKREVSSSPSPPPPSLDMFPVRKYKLPRARRSRSRYKKPTMVKATPPTKVRRSSRLYNILYPHSKSASAVSAAPCTSAQAASLSSGERASSSVSLAESLPLIITSQAKNLMNQHRNSRRFSSALLNSGSSNDVATTREDHNYAAGKITATAEAEGAENAGNLAGGNGNEAASALEQSDPQSKEVDAGNAAAETAASKARQQLREERVRKLVAEAEAAGITKGKFVYDCTKEPDMTLTKEQLKKLLGEIVPLSKPFFKCAKYGLGDPLKIPQVDILAINKMIDEGYVFTLNQLKTTLVVLFIENVINLLPVGHALVGLATIIVKWVFYIFAKFQEDNNPKLPKKCKRDSSPDMGTFWAEMNFHERLIPTPIIDGSWSFQDFSSPIFLQKFADVFRRVNEHSEYRMDGEDTEDEIDLDPSPNSEDDCT